MGYIPRHTYNTGLIFIHHLEGKKEEEGGGRDKFHCVWVSVTADLEPFHLKPELDVVDQNWSHCLRSMFSEVGGETLQLVGWRTF